MTTLIFLIVSYLLLMRLVTGAGEFDIVAPLYGIDTIYEQIFVGFICNLLFLMAFDMFYWRSCRDKTGAVCRCKSTVEPCETQTWKQLRGHTISDHAPNQHHDVIASYDVNNDNPYFRL